MSKTKTVRPVEHNGDGHHVKIQEHVERYVNGEMVGRRQMNLQVTYYLQYISKSQLCTKLQIKQTASHAQTWMTHDVVCRV